MGIEIEKKFLVKETSWKDGSGELYCQGYLCSDRKRTVRVRIAGNKAWLTIKSPTIGSSRQEFEYAIPLTDANELLELCDKPYIRKYRQKVQYAGYIWDVDEFLDENAGLLLAEIELNSEDEVFTVPPWVGEDVTGDHRYANSGLAKKPYTRWSSNDKHRKS